MLVKELLLLIEGTQTAGDLFNELIKLNPKLNLELRMVDFDGPPFLAVVQKKKADEAWVFGAKNKDSKTVWLVADDDEHKLSIKQLEDVVKTGKYNGQTIKQLFDMMP